MRLETLFPQIIDVGDEYKAYRLKGENRDEACKHVIQNYEKELSDLDDAPQIWIGLAKVTGDRHELTSELYTKAEMSFNALAIAYPEMNKFILESKLMICALERIGNEAVYKPRKIFKPGWEVGDTFVYQMPGIQERLERVEPSYKGCNWSLNNKVVLVRKVQEILSKKNIWEQIVYLSVCDQDHIPKNSQELNELGYIPGMMVHSQKNKYEFKFSIAATSKRYLEAFHLTKIGCFPDIIPPRDEIEPPPLRGVNQLFPACGPADFSSIELYASYYIKHGSWH